MSLNGSTEAFQACPGENKIQEVHQFAWLFCHELFHCSGLVGRINAVYPTPKPEEGDIIGRSKKKHAFGINGLNQIGNTGRVR